MNDTMKNTFNSIAQLDAAEGKLRYWSLKALENEGLGAVSTLPNTLKILLEALVRNCDGRAVSEDDVKALAGWDPQGETKGEIAFHPARVLLQDFTGVPAVVDLAAMREAMARLGGDPKLINPLIPADLVIDHSVQVDCFGSEDSMDKNSKLEYQRNKERYEFLKWGQRSFDNFRVVPPSTGIIHQVNLELIADVVARRDTADGPIAIPDTLVGTDSHTTMINGLGVLGWGVGGIEAEAAMLGQPLYMQTPAVVGVKLTGEPTPGVTATDIVLTITEMLRKHGVVGKLVEFYGPGVGRLSLPDRAVIANMAPEYGATAGFFPVDDETLNYLRLTGRPGDLVDRVERYSKEQGLFREGDGTQLRFGETVELDMCSVEPSIAGPKRPQDRIALSAVKESFADDLGKVYDKKIQQADAPFTVGDIDSKVNHGSVAIASITSCTNTSSPALMLGAGIVAKKAVKHGLSVRPWVKASLAPGSRVVTEYLDAAGLTPYLEALRFHTVGYGCATCIGNSGPLPGPVGEAIAENDLIVAGVLSGNRNFEGRINPLVKANYLASPPLVVAYALAGSVEIDITTQPIGFDPNGVPVMLADIWPTEEEIKEAVDTALSAELFSAAYADAFTGDKAWQAIKTVEGELYKWDEDSTYIRNPTFFTELTREVTPPKPISGARVLAMLGESVTTDHISPAGVIAEGGPAASYLTDHGVEKTSFNSFGSRRGNHEVMMRGTFANVRLRNLLAPGTEGGVTVHQPSGEQTSIFEAAQKYAEEGVSLIIIAGKDYGMGSSRDWAAKGTNLLGVRAVIAESYERIHRSNLVGMGVMPLQFMEGQTPASLGLTGKEVFEISGLGDDLAPGAILKVTATGENGSMSFGAVARLDTPVDVDYYRNGGILQTVIRGLLDK
jgi:aconitate hydratase